MRMAAMLTTLSLALISAGTSAQNVTWDYDKEADFTRYRTYTWVAGTNLDDRINHRRVMAAVDAQLATKGLRRVEANENPDMLVAYHASFDRDLQINASSFDTGGWGAYRFGSNRNGSARVQEILVGTLMIDLVDAGTRTVVWRGIASKEIDVKADPEKRDKNMNKAAEKLFRKYPPAKQILNPAGGSGAAGHSP
jgi:hypothetical protein